MFVPVGTTLATMPITRSWFDLHLRKFALAAACVVFLLVCALGMAVLTAQVSQKLDDTHQAAFKVLDDIAVESDQLLLRLELEDGVVCDAATLRKLRGYLFDYHYFREIGLLNPGGALVCSTSHGMLEPPLALNGDTVSAPNGTLTRFQVPVDITQGRVRASTVQRGRFHLVVEPYVLDLLTTQVDVMWFNTPARRGVAYMAEWLSSDDLQTFNTLYLRNPDHSRTTWTRQGIVVSSVKDDGAYAVQTRQSWSSIFASQRALVGAILALAGVMAVLGYLALLPRLRRRMTLEARIHKLCHPAHVVCMYQPLLDLNTRAVVGCEVLMRLQDGPVLRMPDETIPAILARQLTWQLDQAVSRKALDELLQHLPAGRPFRIAFNFFPDSIRAKALSEHLSPPGGQGLPPHITLDLEITEYNMSESLVSEVRKLRHAGFHISIDDFGTGFSNLKLLSDIHPETLKIDRSFVMDMEDRSLRSSLIPEMVLLARAVGAKVLAEGVENAEQARLLQNMGVDFAQGYYFGRPMRIAELVALLQTP